MFKKLLIGLTMAVCSLSFAATIDTSGLSEAQVAEIKAIAAKKVAEVAGNKTTSSDVSSVVSLAATWGQQASVAAEGFAKAISLAARELGITVNDFLKTDAGKLTAILIIWKVAGASLASLFVGLLVFITGMIITRIIYSKLFTKEYVQVPYNHFFGLFSGTKTVRVPKPFSQFNGEGEWFAFIIMIGIVAITLVSTGVLIS